MWYPSVSLAMANSLVLPGGGLGMMVGTTPVKLFCNFCIDARSTGL